MSHAGHEIVKCCACGAVLAQCRCIAADKSVRWVQPTAHPPNDPCHLSNATPCGVVYGPFDQRCDRAKGHGPNIKDGRIISDGHSTELPVQPAFTAEAHLTPEYEQIYKAMGEIARAFEEITHGGGFPLRERLRAWGRTLVGETVVRDESAFDELVARVAALEEWAETAAPMLDGRLPRTSEGEGEDREELAGVVERLVASARTGGREGDLVLIQRLCGLLGMQLQL